MTVSSFTDQILCFSPIRTPVILDMAADRTRCRFINVVTILLLFTYVASGVWSLRRGIAWMPYDPGQDISIAPLLNAVATNGDVSVAILSIIKDQLFFNDSRSANATKEQTLVNYQTYGSVINGIPVILGNSYYQHWMMTPLSFVINLALAIYSSMGIDIPTQEDFLSDPIAYFLKWMLTTELFLLVVAYLILLISWIIKKPRDFFLIRKKNYVAVVRKMLHPVQHDLNVTDIELHIIGAPNSGMLSNLKDAFPRHHFSGWLRKHLEVVKYLARQIFSKRPRCWTSDAFYFPQRLMIACSLSFFAMFLLSCITILIGRRLAVFVYTIAYFIWKNPTATDLFWATHYSSFGIALLGCLVTLWNWLHVFDRYKSNILNMRCGNYFFERGEFYEFNAPRYIGFQLCHTICQHLALLFFSISFVFGCFFLYLTPTIFSDVKDVIISSSITLAMTIVIRRVLNMLVFWADHGTLIDNFRWFAWYDYAWIFFDSIAGITFAIVRYVAGVIIASIQSGRVDLTVIPQRPMLQPFDIVYNTYVASILIDHQTNNPILSVAVDLFVDMVKKGNESERWRAPSRQRAHNRWWLFVVLTNNPSLIQHRKERDLHLAVQLDEL